LTSTSLGCILEGEERKVNKEGWASIADHSVKQVRKGPLTSAGEPWSDIEYLIDHTPPALLFSRLQDLTQRYTLEEETMGKERNRGKCQLCEEVIESKFRHDMVWCKCGEIFVDGGLDYYRRGAMHMENFIEVREEEEEENDATGNVESVT